MAYNYKPNNYNIYDDSKTFEENVQAGAVFTKEKMDKLEEAVKYASADIEIGEVSAVDQDKAAATVEFDKAQIEKAGYDTTVICVVTDPHDVKVNLPK